MKEMLWAEPPQTIEYYTIKKQMSQYKFLKNKSINSLNNDDFV
jgi:hypothetical protein